MASLRKKARSPFWFACFTLPDGRRVQRSTKETNKREAQKKADQWELLSTEKAKARQAHRVIADIYQSAHSTALPGGTVKSYFEGWIARRQHEVAPATYRAYKRTSERFLAFLGDDAGLSLAELDTSQFLNFRDAEASRVTAGTVNNYTKHLRIILEDARREGFIGENPAKDCNRLKSSAAEGKGKRRPFTVAELQRILAIADGEMRSLIIFGLYTGQRLGDLSALTWANIDLAAKEVVLNTQKTGRTVIIPISTPLLNHIASLPASDNPNAFIHPKAAGFTGPGNSNRFSDLLANAGLVAPRPRDGSKKVGREAKRATSQLSFHSLRHTATSLMKNAGVSPAVVQDIIGHQSAEMSAHYTHIESAVKREALEGMPDLTLSGL
jgi:integrase